MIVIKGVVSFGWYRSLIKLLQSLPLGNKRPQCYYKEFSVSWHCLGEKVSITSCPLTSRYITSPLLWYMCDAAGSLEVTTVVLCLYRNCVTLKGNVVWTQCHFSLLGSIHYSPSLKNVKRTWNSHARQVGCSQSRVTGNENKISHALLGCVCRLWQLLTDFSLISLQV